MEYKVTSRKPLVRKEDKKVVNPGTGAMPELQPKVSRPKRASANKVPEV